MASLRNSISQILRTAQQNAAQTDAPRREKAKSQRIENLAFLRLSVDSARAEMNHLHGSFHDAKDRISLSLYVTLFDLADAICLTASHRPSIAVPTLARQALDAYVDFINVLTHENYWKRLELMDDIKWKTALEHASAGRNPYLQSITEHDGLNEMRKAHTQQISEWERQSIKPLEPRERFCLAGMENEYQGIWANLSSAAHNNLSSVMSTRFDLDASRPRELILEPEIVPYESAAIAHTGYLLMEATEKIHRRNGKKDIDLSNVRTAEEKLRDIEAPA